MSLEDYSFLQLEDSLDLSTFDCGDADINEFLREDARNYQAEHMAKTWVFTNNNRIIAFFSISNDCLTDLGEKKGFTNTIWNRLHRKVKVPNEKRFKNYPAIKIGRPGVCLENQRDGLAYELMKFIKGFAILELKSACRFLLIDAYNKERQIKYYTNNGFSFLLDDDKDNTLMMYYDLKPLYNA